MLSVPKAQPNIKSMLNDVFVIPMDCINITIMLSGGCDLGMVDPMP